MSSIPLLELNAVTKEFPLEHNRLRRLLSPGRTLRAVDRVSLSVAQGEVVGLVGESGSGKTTTAQLIVRLFETSAGTIRYRGEDITRASGRALKPFRRRVQMVFQDSQSALNPRKTVRRALIEALRFRYGRAPELEARAVELLATAGLGPEVMGRYPHALSGGQRQRVGIARALAMEPEFIIADEPVSALDVSLQAQIINLLKELRAERGLTMLFISHDLALVNHLCDRVAVMYAGGIVETGSPDNVLQAAAHPYSRALIAAVPRGLAHRRDAKAALPAAKTEISGPGCPFAARCPEVMSTCRSIAPALKPITPTHSAACHLLNPT
jgi:oligopeptide/dipeptide ABC transporter ATP-binding protein